MHQLDRGIFVGRVVRTAVGQQQLHNVDVVHHHTSVKRRLAKTIGGKQHTPTVDQARGRQHAVVDASDVQRGVAGVVAHVDVGGLFAPTGPVLEQQQEHRGVVLLRRNVQRCKPIVGRVVSDHVHHRVHELFVF